MFVRKYKKELLVELDYWEKKLLTHWKAHKKPGWSDEWESRTTTKTRNKNEVIVATIWITQGARGCSCYKNSPVLQNIVTNYYLTHGAVDACTVIIHTTTKGADLNSELLLTGTRKLLI